MVPSVRERQFPLVAGGTGYACWVHLDDAASGTVLALERDARGVFNIVDAPAPASEWLPSLAVLWRRVRHLPHAMWGERRSLTIRVACQSPTAIALLPSRAGSVPWLRS
jgi:nucleoside-diphosphate-sugar epimerase